MAALVCVDDFEAHARTHLPKYAFEYFSCGAQEEQTLQDNKDAFKRLRLLPRLMRDVSNRDLSTTILGQQISFPIAISPTGKHCLAHPDGEIATAKAASSMQTGMVVSSWSTKRLEDITAASPQGLKWFQLIIFKDKSLVQRLIQRAEKAGCKGIVVTIDSVVLGKKYSLIRHKQGLPHPYRFENFVGCGYSDEELRYESTITKMKDETLTWHDIDWIKSVTSLPIILKGIMTAEDAHNAVLHKADAIIVSNHGGRLLDGALATIDALPEIVQAVHGSDIEVYLDGGIRKGTDVLKALALGAKAVFVGRPVLWGLATDGEAGVKKVLQILRDEFDIAMALSGCKTLKEITPDLVERRQIFSSNL
ncbi:2-Hydroxyacid oxidase 1-like isoform X1 [Amphiura filiformis]|uniref:2-Hydroxyacid oxidase 1-like isoform X1 n=1 Tax=Amphiura filiformis TaxID=82378 RepID=UPI003B21E7C9